MCHGWRDARQDRGASRPRPAAAVDAPGAMVATAQDVSPPPARPRRRVRSSPSALMRKPTVTTSGRRGPGRRRPRHRSHRVPGWRPPLHHDDGARCPLGLGRPGAGSPVLWHAPRSTCAARAAPAGRCAGHHVAAAALLRRRQHGGRVDRWSHAETAVTVLARGRCGDHRPLRGGEVLVAIECAVTVSRGAGSRSGRRINVADVSPRIPWPPTSGRACTAKVTWAAST